MKKSKLFGLNVLDFLKGLIMSVGTPLLYLLQETLPNFGLEQWQKIALSALIAYLLKQFVTDNNGNIMSLGGSNTPPNKDEK
jgi:hypothetical protein